ncbi:hypothetical protein GGI07_001886 [Coemansia sp. Benny D115]|nr:hypothetical protein GGI07_001886 [Coemansia sp. Benny D115]
MYAEIERLLAQVTSERGCDLLNVAPASSTQNTSQTLGTPLHQTSTRTTGLPPLDGFLQTYSGSNQPVIELLGASGSGKTQALYRICSTFAMPATVTLPSDKDQLTVPLGGHGQHVLFVDIDGKLCTRLLAHHIRWRLKNAIASSSPNHTALLDDLVDDLVDDCLDRVHVFSPESTQSAVATLAMLPGYLKSRNVQGSDLGVLLIDGLGANFWYDKRAAEQVKLKVKRATAWFRIQQLLVDTIQQSQRVLGCLCVATCVLFLRRNEQQLQQGLGLNRQGSGGSTDDLTLSASPRDTSAGSEGGVRDLRAKPRVFVGQLGGTPFRDHMIARWGLSVVDCSFLLESSPAAAGQSDTVATFTRLPQCGDRGDRATPSSPADTGQQSVCSVRIGPRGMQDTVCRPSGPND